LENSLDENKNLKHLLTDKDKQFYILDDENQKNINLINELQDKQTDLENNL